MVVAVKCVLRFFPFSKYIFKNRKATETVRPRFSKITKIAMHTTERANVHLAQCKAKRKIGKMARASKKKSFGKIAEFRQITRRITKYPHQFQKQKQNIKRLRMWDLRLSRHYWWKVLCYLAVYFLLYFAVYACEHAHCLFWD